MSRIYQVIEDGKDFILIDKSPGVSVHRDQAAVGLLNVIKEDQGLSELHLVHRLDKMASGLLLLAKNVEANRALSQQFQNRLVEKYYVALSDRRPKKKQGLIKGDMEKGRRGVWKLMPGTINPAITQFFSQSVEGGGRLFLLKPFTGKTHQLRVAMKSLGSPVLGDSSYCPKGSDSGTSSGKLEKISPGRGYLHSYVLGFQLYGQSYRFLNQPTIGDKFTSRYFKKALSGFAEPWDLPWPIIK